MTILVLRIMRYVTMLGLIVVMFTHVHWSLGVFGLLSFAMNETLAFSQRWLVKRYSIHPVLK